VTVSPGTVVTTLDAPPAVFVDVVGATVVSVVVGAAGAGGSMVVEAWATVLVGGAAVAVGAAVTVVDTAGAAGVVAAGESSVTTGPAGPEFEPQAAVRRTRTPRPTPIIRPAIAGP
jgi:hypothetical protein